MNRHRQELMTSLLKSKKFPGGGGVGGGAGGCLGNSQ